MNKSIIYGLGIACLVIGLNSCGKTTKRKITNDWKIVSLEEEKKSPASQQTYSKTTMTETTVSHSSTYTIWGPDSTYTYSGTSGGMVKVNNMTIKKDGTWQWVQELFYANTAGPNSQNTTNTKDLSGTWSFVGKTKGNDFKKNERIVFNVLLDKYSTFDTPIQGTINDYSEEFTYLTGENTMTFTVKESKKKELELEMESASNYSNSWGPEVYPNSKTLKMTLKEQ